MYRDKPVTRRNVANQFGVPVENIEQIDSKQLFIISGCKTDYLISYYTIVGFRPNGNKVWNITTRKYSRTTNKQLSQFSHGRSVEWVDNELIPKLIE